MVKVKLSKQFIGLAKFLSMIDERGKFRRPKSDPWKVFQDGFYSDSHVGGFHRSVHHVLQKNTSQILSENHFLSDFLSSADIHWILTLFLQSFFVGKLSGAEYLLGDKTFEDEAAQNKETLSEVMRKQSLDESHETFLHKFINVAYNNAKKKEILWIFPMYFFDLNINILDLEFMGVRFYHNNQSGFDLLLKDFPETTPELTELIKNLREGRDTSLPAFIALKTKGSQSKCFVKSSLLVQQLFSFLKIVIHKNSIPGMTSFGENFSSRKPRELDGVFHVLTQEGEKVKSFQTSWIDVENVDNSENGLEEKNYHYADNFFQHVYVPVRSGVSCGLITLKNLGSIKRDLKFFEDFFEKFKKASIRTTLENAASFFSEARKEENPIKQVILGTIAIEAVISSETGGKKGIGTSDVFENRLANLLQYAFQGDWGALQSFLGAKVKNHSELETFIGANIYKYRSGLVHGRNRKIAYLKNNLLIKISAHALFFTAKLAYENNIGNTEKLQKLMDKPIK